MLEQKQRDHIMRAKLREDASLSLTLHRSFYVQLNFKILELVA